VRTCTVCSHAKRKEIDGAILAGNSERSIAKRYGATSAAVHRHKVKCASTALEKAAEEQTWTITGQMRDLCFRAARTLEKAEKSGKVRHVSVASREARETLMALAKLTGELDESTRVNVLIHERNQREARQATDLQRLTLGERLELQRLLAKAQGADEPLPALPALAGATTEARRSGLTIR
jgi:hypothetical protein